MADVWNVDVERTGDRMTVYASVWGEPELWTVHKGEITVFVKLAEARVMAEKLGYDDGIWVVFKSYDLWKKGRKTKKR